MRMRSIVRTFVIGLSLVFAVLVRTGHAESIVIFQDRVAFTLALQSDPTFATRVEGWDTYPAGTVFANGSTANGITYNVSTGEALVVATGISLSPPNNLYQNACPTLEACRFRPLIDTFTFGFSQPIRAFGITFSSTFANQNGDYLLTTDRGNMIPSFFDPVYPGFGLGQFAGFISDKDFTQVTVSSTANALYGMDDLVYARPVPEPSSLVLFGIAIISSGIYAGARRRSDLA